MADVNGTNGNNTISLSGTVQQFTATIVNPYSGKSIFIDELKNVNSLSYDGLAGTDTLLGSNLGDVIFAENSLGNLLIFNMERINGGAGGDIIVMATNNHILNDMLLRGATEDDIIWANAGNDILQGATGNDIMDGGPGNDVLEGQGDNDTLSGGSGSDVLAGGNGNDTLEYFADGVWGAVSTVNVGSGDAVSLNGLNRSFDIFDGGVTFENGAPVDDTATTTDTLVLTSGNDALLLDDFSSARLTIGGLHPLGVTYTNSSATAARVIAVDVIDTGDGNDVVNLTSNTFTYGNVTILGGQGNDTLWSAQGNDILNGGAGDDNLQAGTGDDTYTYTSGIDTVQDSGGIDTLTLGAGINFYDLSFARSGNDLLITLNSGNTVTVINQLLSGSEIENLHMNNGDNYNLVTIATNQAPTPQDDIFNVAMNGSLFGNVILDNGNGADSDPEFSGLTVIGFTATSVNGSTVFVGGNGDMTYTPAFGFSGVDTFTYTVYDGIRGLGEATATVTINVIAPNVDPVAADDSFSGQQDQVFSGNVLLDNGGGVDSDSDGGTLSVSSGVFATTNGGSVTLDSLGNFAYTPTSGFFGTDTFSYTLLDGQGGFDNGTVSFILNGAPIAADDDFSGIQDNAIIGNILVDNGHGVDADVDGGTLSVQTTTFTTVNGATVSILSNGLFVYSPASGCTGVDTLTHTIFDGQGGSDTGTITVTLVAPPNVDPVAVDDAFNGQQDVNVLGNVLADNGSGADSDSDGGTLSVIAATIATANGGTVVLNATGDFTYTPASGFFGSDSFDYTLLDGQGGSDMATVALFLNGKPIADDDSFNGQQDAAILGNVIGNDSDVDGGTITVSAATIATVNGGTVTIDAAGDFTYTPAVGFFGSDTFDYTLNDGQDGSDTATVALFLNGKPIAANDDFSADQDTVVTGNVLADNGHGADADVDGGTLTVVAATIATAHGSVVLQANGSFTYTPTLGYFGSDTFTYTLLDGQGGNAVATATINLAEVVGGGGTIIGTPNDDTLNGSAGNDTISGLGANDKLYGNGGADELDGGTGKDIVDGGNGDDILHFSVDAQFGKGWGAWNVGSPTTLGTQEVISVKNKNESYDYFIGGAGTDTLVMTGDHDALFLDGAIIPRHDDLAVGARISGIEIIIAGDGNDVVDLTSNNYAYGDVTIYGGDGNDYLWSSSGVDHLYGDDGNDQLYADNGDDFLFGGDGNDVMLAGNGDDRLEGDKGNDTLKGDAGNDVLLGGQGNDEIRGGTGDDLIVGGEGNDKLYGEAGADTFLYQMPSEGNDKIYGFEKGVGKDSVNITDILFGYDSLTSDINAFMKLHNSGGDVQLRINNDGVGNDFQTLATFVGGLGGANLATLLSNGNVVADQHIAVS
jgi:Ca2+-binding RTX toxin-like protein